MPENKYRVVMNGSTYDITEDGVSYRVVKDNKPYGSIDLRTASKEAITAFQLGIFFGTSQVLDRMQEQTANNQEDRTCPDGVTVDNFIHCNKTNILSKRCVRKYAK